MKFLKRFFLILGAVLVLATAGLLLYAFRLSTDSLNAIISAALQGKSLMNDVYNRTQLELLIGVIGALIGGIVLGIGIAWPRRTFKRRLEDKQAAEAAAAQSAADKAAQRQAQRTANQAPTAAE